MTAAEILEAFPKLSVLVVGDICLDRWCTYDPDVAEPSRETGIPRIGVVETEVTPGAGGTVANNLAALGAGRVAVCGAVGRDGYAYELRAALAARGIGAELLVESPRIQTFTYTKLLNRRTGEEDLPRVDFINVEPLPAEAERRILETVDEEAGGFDVLIVSDQAETSQGGVVTPAVRDLVAGLAERFPRQVIWVDSRERPELFRNVIVKPNEQEARAACRRLGIEEDFQALRRRIGERPLVITRGADGALVVDDAGERLVAGRRIEKPVDICGAGDSFSAGAALTLAVTGSIDEAVRMGNLVASITIMKKGTGTASPEELLQAVESLP